MSGSWKEEYQRKMVSPEEAVKVVRDGDRVSFTYGREPRALGLALAARLGEVKDVKVFIRTPAMDFGWYDPGWEESFKIEISYVLPITREMMAQRRCDFVIGGLLGMTPRHPAVAEADVLFTEVSPPDENGHCSFGASVWGKKKAVECAKVVLAEVNKNLIRTYGENYVHVSEIDYFVEHVSGGKQPGATDLLGRKTWEPGEVEKRIAEYVSTLIKDGNTLQIGVGSTSEWIAQLGALNHRSDLGWHSETTPRGIIKLVREGVITGKRKNINRGKVIAVAVGGGDQEDMDFVNHNPLFELYDADYVLNPAVIGSNDTVVAVNSAISVDLTGQIAAESVGPTLVSGPGGQLAFATGAQLSKGGRFISTLPSTAKNGSVSRIVPQLEKGTIATIPRTLADIVVTEYGIAHLYGKTQRERAMELINIAHPDFRAELKKEAQGLFWP
ncbi:MAG: 4-hydroxybutyrate CoA transferase [Deltaproteobacteria bacterium]|nr:4-hydroxybutyrate CoA transferase [Deltaproteobacteria bacterium]